MEELKNLIIEYFNKNNKGFSEKELRKNFNIKGEEQTNIFYSALNVLVEDGSLFFDGKTYKLFTPNLGVAYGEIEINKSGNGFIHTKYGTIFIEKEKLNGALNGDKVIVGNINFGRKQDYKGEVFKILKRRNGKLIFKVEGNSFNCKLLPYNKFETVDVFINKNQLKDLRNGDYVSVEVSTEQKDGKFYATIDKVVGTENTKDIDIKLLFEEYNIPIEFSNEIEEELKLIPNEVTETDIKGRVDLRDKNIITIDCDSTKDRDDAVFVEKLENNNYKLLVNIAHISYYIKEDSEIFKEALKRCNSHYVNNTCNPMLPTEISNGICSLNENTDRLTKTCEMEINDLGEVVNYSIYDSVINSKKAMKYSDVNKILSGENVDGYEDFIEQLKLMDELNNILTKARENRNYINFGISDIEIIENNFGNIENFKKADTGKSQNIIENFMVITNETVAKHFYWLPFIYRVHEAPDEALVNEVLGKLKMAGYSIPKINTINEYSLNNVLTELNKIDTMDIAKSEILKRMKRARYSIENLGHFALQLENYCHFTAPIRRIADLIIQMLTDKIETLDYNIETIQEIECNLQNICENASRLEKISKEIEQKGLMTEMARYMEKHIGEEFEAYISEVYQNGMFVKTNNMIQGKVKLEDIAGDKYYYDFDKNSIIGKKEKRRYTIGQKVYVIAKDASAANRTINFEIKQKSLKK